MSAIRGCIADAASGAQKVLLIRGEPGIGKTRLVEEAITTAEASRFKVLRGTGDEFGISRPFGLIRDLLHSPPSGAPKRTRTQPRRAEGRAFPSGPDEQYRNIDAFVESVEDIASAGPVLLALDDLQWADPASLAVIHALAKRLATLPIVLIGSYRPLPRIEELDRLLDALIRHGSHTLELSRLTDEAVVGLVSELVGARPGRRLRDQIEKAGGNPFFVIELVDALMREGDLEVGHGRADVTREVAPPALKLIMLQRFRLLSDDALELLRLASVLGTNFRVSELSIAVGRPTSALVPEILEAVSSGVLEGADDEIAFRHDLMRQAIYEDMPSSLRSELHMAISRALAESGADLDRIAEHVARGAAPGDVESAELLIRSVDAAMLVAPAIAARFLARVLDLLPPDDDRRDRIETDLVVALLWSGRLSEAEERASNVLSREHDASVEGELHVMLGRILLGESRFDEAVEQIMAALAGPGLSDRQRAHLIADAGLGATMSGQFDLAVGLGQQARAQGDELDDHLAFCLGTNVVANTSVNRGFVSEGLHELDEAVRRAATSDQREVQLYSPLLFLSSYLTDSDNLEAAAKAATEGRRLAETSGAFWLLPMYQTVSLVRLFHSGEWDDCIAEYEAGIELVEDAGSTVGVLWDAAVRAIVAIHRDDLHTAEQALRRAEPLVNDSKFKVELLLWARALLSEAQGRPEEALGYLRWAHSLTATIGRFGEHRYIGPDLVRLAVKHGEEHLAALVCGEVQEAARRAGVPSADAAAARCRAHVDGDAEAAMLAVEILRASPRLLERAQACEEAGILVVSQGESAVPLLQEARGVYESLDAHWDLARVDSVLRGLGVRRGRSGSSRRPSTGWDSLSPTETKVVALVQEGLTNAQVGARLFISRRTVETHLAHVFTKLTVSSRVELAAVAARRGASGYR